MSITLDDLIINISHVDLSDIVSCWNWLLTDIDKVILVSKIGDLFLQDKNACVYWLATDSGEFTQIAKDVNEFQQLLNDESLVDNWFLPGLVEELQNAGIFLGEDQVYSYKMLPAIGGIYSIENIEPTNISVHFAFTGQIHEQIKDLPEGTHINIKLTK
jgi:hypothetical protein